MLSEFQVGKVWENMLAAETRALYFADLAARYTRRKQWITGISFFLSSGAAATLIGKSPQWIPVTAATVSAISGAYSMAVGLDRKVATLAKLHSAWNVIAVEYQQLWNHTYSDDAEQQFDRIIRSEKEPSELATTEAPNDVKLLEHWQERVFAMYNLNAQHAS